MNMIRILLATAAIALSAIAQSEEIRITPGELENLGIRFASPARATEVAGTEATARVVIPPSGDAVVGAPQSGLLTGLSAAIGDNVVAGQVLAELRSPDFVALQREFLDALNTCLLAQNAFARDEQLYAEGIISARRLQETTTNLRIAEAGLNEHRQLLKIAGLSDAGIRTLENSQQLLDSLQITSPFDGVIVDRMATIGQRLDAMSPIYRLADLSELWLEINVPQERVAGIRPGMRVSVASRTGDYTALVTTVGRAIDPSTQAITVRARFGDSAEGLRPGQFVAVRIVAELDDSLATNIWTIPVAAVTRSGDAHFIFVRTQAGVEARQVDVIGVDEDLAYLSASIEAGDAIAVSGISALKAIWSAQSVMEAG